VDISKARAAVGAVTLVAGAIAELAQYVAAPAHISGGSAADQIAAVGGNFGRMQVGLWLDVLILVFYIPAMLFLGRVAGSRHSRFAGVATVLAFVGSLFGGYLLANDVVLYAAAKQEGRPGAAEVLSAFESNGVLLFAVVMGVLFAYLGVVLLGIALIRVRTVPVWAGACVAAAPLLSVAGEATEVGAIAVAGYAVQLIGFTMCAFALVKHGARPAAATKPVVTAAAA
jgi:hypothetical protein